LKVGSPIRFPNFNFTEHERFTSCDHRSPVHQITHVLILQGGSCCTCYCGETALAHASIYCKIQAEEAKRKLANQIKA